MPPVFETRIRLLTEDEMEDALLKEFLIPFTHDLQWFAIDALDCQEEWHTVDIFSKNMN